MDILGYVAMMIVGIVLGGIGSGGSMLSVPILVYLFGMKMEAASAYSLFLVGSTSMAGVVLKQKQRRLAVAPVLAFGVPSVVASFFARNVIIGKIPAVISLGSFQQARSTILIAIFGLMVIASSLALLRKKGPESRSENLQLDRLVFAGFFTGIIAGLVGVGGGFLIVPSLILFGRLSFSEAAVTSLIIIAFNSLSGFCGDVVTHDVEWQFLFGVTAMSLLGLLLGWWLQQRHPNLLISQRHFAWITLGVGVLILVKECPL